VKDMAGISAFPNLSIMRLSVAEVGLTHYVADESRNFYEE
jgi:hypothetical protein